VQSSAQDSGVFSDYDHSPNRIPSYDAHGNVKCLERNPWLRVYFTVSLLIALIAMPSVARQVDRLRLSATYPLRRDSRCQHLGNPGSLIGYVLLGILISEKFGCSQPCRNSDIGFAALRFNGSLHKKRGTIQSFWVSCTSRCSCQFCSSHFQPESSQIVSIAASS
jgi:hypothetical protein